MRKLIVTTTLSGRITVERARTWRFALHAMVSDTPSDSAIRLLVDQTGYHPASLAAHRLVRTVVPDLLAAHGLAPALADLFPYSTQTVNPVPHRLVVACAMVHHEEFKMAELERRLGRRDQRFFSDRTRAREWLESFRHPYDTAVGTGGSSGRPASLQPTIEV